MKNTNYNAMAFLALMLLVGVNSAYAQKRTKTFHENFKVSNNAVLDLNTSYAYIEFETWNKDQVDIQAIIEIEGAIEEQLEASFSSNPIKITGNRKLIEISTGSLNHKLFAFAPENLKDLNIDISEL